MYGAEQAAKEASAVQRYPDAGRTIGTRTPEMRCMDGLITDLDKRLAGVREGINRLSEFRHRLINPRPADAGKGMPPEPTPSTIEARLGLSVRYADQLAQDLSDLCNELDRAA